MKSILLPTVGGPHAVLAAETAAAVAHRTGATVHATYVIGTDATDEERVLGRNLLDVTAESFESEIQVETTLLESDDVVAALVEESANHDLTIIGATREGMLQRFLFGAIPEAVGERAPNTVIMTKRNLDVRSRVQQSIDKLRKRVTGRSSAMERENGNE